MNSLIFVALFAAFAAANAGVISTYSAAPWVSSVVSPVVSAYSAPVVSAGLVGEQTVVAGPSGTVSRTVAAPAVAPVVSSYAAPVLSSYAAPVVARAIW